VSPGVLLGIGVVGGFAAVARFLVVDLLTAPAPRRFPYGVFAVNVSGSFALGVVIGAAVHGDAYRLGATGFLGAFTTFSAWVFDSRQLIDEGESRLAYLNLVLSLVVGLGAIWLGRQLG